MGRSVNCLNNADFIQYVDTSYCTSENDDYDWEFRNPLIEDLQNKFPSLEVPYSPNNMGKWDGRETEIILENYLIEIGISEYCGLSSISIRIKGYCDHPNLAPMFLDHICNFLRKNEAERNVLIKMGTFSNGEGVYKHA